MDPDDPKLKTLAALHEISSDAQRMIESIDRKVEGVTDETITVNVDALRTIRMILFAQRYALNEFVEHQAEMDDFVENAIEQLKKKQ